MKAMFRGLVLRQREGLTLETSDSQKNANSKKLTQTGGRKERVERRCARDQLEHSAASGIYGNKMRLNFILKKNLHTI